MVRDDQNRERYRPEPLSSFAGLKVTSKIEKLLNQVRLHIQSMVVLKAAQITRDLDLAAPKLPKHFDSPATRALMNSWESIQRSLLPQQKLFVDSAKTMEALSAASTILTQKLDFSAYLTKPIVLSQKRMPCAMERLSVSLSPFLPKLLIGNSIAEPISFQFGMNLNALVNDRIAQVLKSVHDALSAKQTLPEQWISLPRFRRLTESIRLHKLNAIDYRLGRLNFPQLETLVRDFTANMEMHGQLSDEPSEAISTQLAEAIAGIPDPHKTSIEEKLNYLIAWTEKHDNNESKQALLTILLNLVSSFLFYVLMDGLPNLLNVYLGMRPQAIIFEMREAIEQQLVPRELHKHVRLIARNNVPLKLSRRT